MRAIFGRMSRGIPLIFFVRQYRNYYAIGLSALLLASVMLAWPDQYLFAKTTFSVLWIDPILLIGLCLIPAGLFTTSARQALNALLGLVLLLPVLPLFSYVMRHDFDGYGLLLINVVMQYLWILALFLLPATPLLLLRFAYARCKTAILRLRRWVGNA